MRSEKTDLADMLVLVPQPFQVDRGLFTRAVDANIFDNYVGARGTSSTTFVQDAQSR